MLRQQIIFVEESRVPDFIKRYYWSIRHELFTTELQKVGARSSSPIRLSKSLALGVPRAKLLDASGSSPIESVREQFGLAKDILGNYVSCFIKNPAHALWMLEQRLVSMGEIISKKSEISLGIVVNPDDFSQALIDFCITPAIYLIFAARHSNTKIS